MEDKFELLVDGLVTDGYFVTDDFFDPSFVENIRLDLTLLHEAEAFHKAGIGKGNKVIVEGAIRNDEVLWIDPTISIISARFLEYMDALRAYINYTCFAGIGGGEFHYAHYEKGGFYKKHLDCFKNSNSRMFTFIIYLNANWQKGDGGELNMFLENGERLIEPTFGRVVCFKSDLIEHEVLKSHKKRLSATGWFKRAEY